MDPISQLKEKGIDDDKIVEYQAAFQMFDVFGRGVFGTAELTEVLSKFSTCAPGMCGVRVCVGSVGVGVPRSARVDVFSHHTLTAHRCVCARPPVALRPSSLSQTRRSATRM